MQPFRFIHCGDLHLGAPFQYATGISRAVDRAVSEATYVAFDTIIDTAIDEHVHAVVIAGDIYNSEDHNLEAQVRFVRGMYRLAEHRIAVYMVQGNHDPAESWKAQLQMPDNVHVFSSEQVYNASRSSLTILKLVAFMVSVVVMVMKTKIMLVNTVLLNGMSFLWPSCMAR